MRYRRPKFQTKNITVQKHSTSDPPIILKTQNFKKSNSNIFYVFKKDSQILTMKIQSDLILKKIGKIMPKSNFIFQKIHYRDPGTRTGWC